MGPRADFTCLSKKCQQDGAASVYELPVTATRCPVCGSKRIRRLYNAVNVGKADARAHAQLVDGSSLPAQADAAKSQRGTGDLTLRGPQLAAAGGSAAGALSIVRRTGGAGASQALSVGILKSLRPPTPGAYRD